MVRIPRGMTEFNRQHLILTRNAAICKAISNLIFLFRALHIPDFLFPVLIVFKLILQMDDSPAFAGSHDDTVNMRKNS
jgi:hypothetical protein